MMLTDEELTADDNWCPNCDEPRGNCMCIRLQRWEYDPLVEDADNDPEGD